MVNTKSRRCGWNYLFVAWMCLFSLIVQGQQLHHWQEIENTPGTQARPFFFFPDGAVAGYLNASEEIALSEDQGETWIFEKASEEFKDFNWNGILGGLNGHLYIKGEGYHDLFEIDRHDLVQRKIYTSSRQIINYAVGRDHFYVVDDNMLVKRTLADGALVESYELPSNQVVQVIVSSDERVACVMANKQMIVLSSELEELHISVPLDIASIGKIKLSQDLALFEPLDNKFRYSLDYGEIWKEVEAANIWNNQQHLGNTSYFVVEDSTVSIFDIINEKWRDTIYLDTYLNISGVSDALYVIPSKSKYQGQLFALRNDSGFENVPIDIGPPDVKVIKALDSTSFYLHETNLLYHSDAYHATLDFQRIHKLSSGEFIASTYDEMYFSENGDDNFEIRIKPTSVRDGITKNELDRLYIFLYNGVYISDDKGITWTHECPDDYFPAFDINERTVQPKVSNIYYGIGANGNVLSFNHNTNITRTSYANSNTNISIGQFSVNLIGNLFITTRNRSTGEVQMFRKMGGQTLLLPTPPDNLKADFAMNNSGQLYIHDGSSIYMSFDRGDSWIDITGDLPPEIVINRISVADDNTVYLGCANGNVHKHIFGDLISDTELVNNNNYLVSPNPSDGLFKISRSSSQNVERVKIYNLHGQLCSSFYLKHGESHVDLSHLVSGIYYVQFELGLPLRLVLN